MDIVDLVVNDLPLEEMTSAQIVHLSSRLMDVVCDRIQNSINKEDVDCE